MIEGERNREQAKSRAMALVAKRREMKAAQQIKLAAVGVVVPSMDEVDARKQRLAAEKLDKYARKLQAKYAFPLVDIKTKMYM